MRQSLSGLNFLEFQQAPGDREIELHYFEEDLMNDLDDLDILLK